MTSRFLHPTAGRPGHHRFPIRRTGMGLIELMIALVIAAILLTATATALNASANAYAVNQEQAALMQQARVAMHRILTAIRTAREHAPEDAGLASDFASGQIVTCNSIALFDEGGADCIFRYDPDNQQLLAIRDGTSHVLARGVQTFSVRMEPMRSATSVRTGGGYDLLRRASILLTVRTTDQTALAAETTGRQTVSLSASITPRRNVW